MHDTPNGAKGRNDLVFTPKSLAKKIIDHFAPSGIVLDPSAGEGAFTEMLALYSDEKPGRISKIDWCEITKGRDFFGYSKKVNWIITNPPWSKLRDFMLHGYDVADNVVYLMTINHVFTKARLRNMVEHGFGIKEIFCFDTPPNFPGSGFQCGAVHFQRDYDGPTTISFDNQETTNE